MALFATFVAANGSSWKRRGQRAPQVADVSDARPHDADRVDNVVALGAWFENSVATSIWVQHN